MEINKEMINLKFITIRGKKIPIILARRLLTITGYIIPLNKFHRDLSISIFRGENKKRIGHSINSK